MDVGLTRRLAMMGAWMRAVSPSWSAQMMSAFLRQVQDGCWPALADHPAFGPQRVTGSAETQLHVVSDDLASNLLDGTADSVDVIQRFSGPQAVTLRDGRELTDVDAIICCTGSMFDFSALLPPECDPTNPDFAPDKYSALKAAKCYRDGIVVSRTYWKFLSLQHPHSLAFLGNCIYRRGACPLYDLASMALAQVWKGAFPMPTQAEMERQCDDHYAFLVREVD